MREGQKLPVWRLIAGVAVLGCLLLAGAVIVPVYVADYHLRQYVRALAANPDARGASDEILRRSVAERARQLELPVHAEDVIVMRTDGRTRLQVARYKAQVFHADLHFSPLTTK